jgi:hypothetical protein
VGRLATYYELLDRVRRDGEREAWAARGLGAAGARRSGRNRLFVYDRYLTTLNEGTEAA